MRVANLGRFSQSDLVWRFSGSSTASRDSGGVELIIILIHTTSLDIALVPPHVDLHYPKFGFNLYIVPRIQDHCQMHHHCHLHGWVESAHSCTQPISCMLWNGSGSCPMLTTSYDDTPSSILLCLDIISKSRNRGSGKADGQARGYRL